MDIFFPPGIIQRKMNEYTSSKMLPTKFIKFGDIYYTYGIPTHKNDVFYFMLNLLYDLIKY